MAPDRLGPQRLLPLDAEATVFAIARNRPVISTRLIAAFATIVLIVGHFGALAQEGAEALARAEAAMASNPPDLQEALRQADNAIEANERLWAGHLIRGLVLGQMGRGTEALESFQRATSLSPGQPAAHRAAAIAAFNEERSELAFENLVQAIQAGDEEAAGLIDAMTASVPPPPDLASQLEAARIFLEPIDMEMYRGTIDVAQLGGVSRRDPRLLNQPAVSDNVLDFYEMSRQMRQALVTSGEFGLVPAPDMARYSMVIEIHDVGGGVRVGGEFGDTPTSGGPQSVRGYVKIRDLRTNDWVYSRLLDLSNMSSIADLHADMTRHVEFLAVWLAEENR